MKSEQPRFAVLIDADNVNNPAWIEPILREIRRYGRVTVCRIFGDFTTPHLSSWKLTLAEHAIQPVQQYRNTVGKNASDSALIIDAMDLLHSRRFDGFCIVSSDSDFTRLATRIREDGHTVYGIGEKKAPKAFVSACDRYFHIENLLDPVPTPEPKTIGVEVDTNDRIPETLAAATPPASLESPIELLRDAYRNVADDDGPWVMLGKLSSNLHANHSDFDPRSYGQAKFKDLVAASGYFELEERTYKNGHAWFCRPAYRKALKKAVSEAAGSDGWATTQQIGMKLREIGLSIEDSGYRNLTEALRATGDFHQSEAGGSKSFKIAEVR